MRFLVLFSLLLSGCTSSLKKAESLLEKGQSWKALEKIDEGLRENPEDAEWLELRTKARLKWIDQNLIQVRLLRLSENFGESEETLRQTIYYEDLWNTFPKGAVFTTQKDELELYSVRIRNRISNYIQNATPFRSQLELNKSRSIFTNTLQQDPQVLQNEIDRQGQGFCKKAFSLLKKDDYFTYRFLQKPCQKWKAVVPQNKVSPTVSFFKDLEMNFDVKGWPLTDNSVIKTQFKNAFAKSVWFDPHGRQVLNLGLAGEFSNDITSETKERSAVYYVQVPYDYSEVRPKQPQPQGIAAFFSLLSAISGDSPRVKDNGDGTETVTETRYRSEPRNYNYSVLNFHQHLLVKLDNQLSIQNKALNFKFADHLKKESDEHANNFPDAHVTPQKREFVQPSDWLLTLVPSMTQRLDEVLSQQWEEIFCQDQESTTEVALRCHYGIRPRLPSLMEKSFYQSYQVHSWDWQQTADLY